MQLYKNITWFKHKYLIENLASREMAVLCNVDERTISRWRERFGIKRKKRIVNKTKDLRCRVSSSFYNKFVAYCDYKNVYISLAIKMALTEFLINNNFNPYREKGLD